MKLLKLVTKPLAILRWQFIVLDSTPVSLSRYEGICTLAKLFFVSDNPKTRDRSKCPVVFRPSRIDVRCPYHISNFLSSDIQWN